MLAAVKARQYNKAAARHNKTVSHHAAAKNKRQRSSVGIVSSPSPGTYTKVELPPAGGRHHAAGNESQ